jgi:hypothetical protein
MTTNLGFPRGNSPYPSQMEMAVRRLGRRVVSAQGEGRKTRGPSRGILSLGQGGPQRNPGAYEWHATCTEMADARQLRVCPVGAAKRRHTSNAKMADPLTTGVHLKAGHRTRTRARRG